MKFATYSHDSYGLGHLKRTFMISRFLAEEYPDSMSLSLTGSTLAHSYFDPYLHNHDFVKIPCIKKVGPNQYAARHLPMEWKEIISLREAIIRQSIIQFNPDVFIIDKTPRGIGDELVNTLHALKQANKNARIILGLRDILDDPDSTSNEWHNREFVDWIRRIYTDIWIWGEKTVYDTINTYSFQSEISKITKYMGYLPPDPREADTSKLRLKAGVKQDQKLVLISAGGGGDALPIYLPVINGLIEANAPDVRFVIVAGPLMSERDFEQLHEAIRPIRDRVKLVRFLTHFVDWMRTADASISMGGYNTLREGAALGKPMLVIPREYPRVEQQIRAKVFTTRGWCYVINPNQTIESATVSFIQNLLMDELHHSLTTLPCQGFVNLKTEIESIRAEMQSCIAIDTHC